MNNIWDRFIELIDSGPTDPLFLQFVSDLGESPQSAKGGHHGYEYQLPRAGIYIMFLHESPEPQTDDALKFAWAFIHPRQGYSGELPGGVCIGDRLEDVQRKLGPGEVLEAGHWMPNVRYDFGRVQVSYGFSKKDHQLMSVNVKKQKSETEIC